MMKPIDLGKLLIEHVHSEFDVKCERNLYQQVDWRFAQRLEGKIYYITEHCLDNMLYNELAYMLRRYLNDR